MDQRTLNVSTTICQWFGLHFPCVRCIVSLTLDPFDVFSAPVPPSLYPPRVAKYNAETKMNTANLALVFGPTLTRAPEGADPRALHNDVPAINVLIQLCIENNDYIFGEDEGELNSPPPPPPTTHEEDKSDEEVLNGTPDQLNPPVPILGSSEDELERDTPQPPPKIPSPVPPVDDDEGESDLRFPVPDSETLAKSSQQDNGPALPPKDDTPTLPPKSDAEVPVSTAPSQSSEQVKQADSLLPISPKHSAMSDSQPSSCSLNTELNKVDEALENIMSTIDSMRLSPTASADKVDKSDGSKEDEEGEGDSDSDDEDSGGMFCAYAVVHGSGVRDDWLPRLSAVFRSYHLALSGATLWLVLTNCNVMQSVL